MTASPPSLPRQGAMATLDFLNSISGQLGDQLYLAAFDQLQGWLTFVQRHGLLDHPRMFARYLARSRDVGGSPDPVLLSASRAIETAYLKQHPADHTVDASLWPVGARRPAIPFPRKAG